MWAFATAGWSYPLVLDAPLSAPDPPPPHQVAIKVLALDGADAILLGSFDLAGISPAVSGKAQVVVTLGLSADGVLHVTAVDRSTERARQIEIRDRMPTPMSTMKPA